jgi:hypothetical protein
MITLFLFLIGHLWMVRFLDYDLCQPLSHPSSWIQMGKCNALLATIPMTTALVNSFEKPQKEELFVSHAIRRRIGVGLPTRVQKQFGLTMD